MEKFQIAKYGMMQVTAIVYGILASGAAVKFNKYWLEHGYTMPDAYYRAAFYRDYGISLLVFAILWTAIISYLSSPLSKWNLDERYLSVSGLALAIFFAIAGSVIAFTGAEPPPHLLGGVAEP